MQHLIDVSTPNLVRSEVLTDTSGGAKASAVDKSRTSEGAWPPQDDVVSVNMPALRLCWACPARSVQLCQRWAVQALRLQLSMAAGLPAMAVARAPAVWRMHWMALLCALHAPTTHACPPCSCAASKTEYTA